MTLRRSLWALLALLILLGAGGFAYLRSQQPLLAVGVGYAARVACGCRHIGNRPLADCYKDFEPGMAPIRLSEDAAAKTVTASVPLIAKRTARYDPLLGCQVARFGTQ